MTNEFKDKFDVWIKVLTLIGSIIAFIFTLITWKEQNYIKRAEFLESKIKEFNDTPTLVARYILDGFATVDTNNAAAMQMTAQQMIDKGSSRIGIATDIKLDSIGKTLNVVLPDTSIARQKVKISFDRLLDFFSKLNWYIDLNLMKKEEAEYFDYYIKQCIENEGVKTYACSYRFKGFFALAKKLNLTQGKSFEEICPNDN